VLLLIKIKTSTMDAMAYPKPETTLRKDKNLIEKKEMFPG
jgi:hypothetical protein